MSIYAYSMHQIDIDALSIEAFSIFVFYLYPVINSFHSNASYLSPDDKYKLIPVAPQSQQHCLNDLLKLIFPLNL